MENINTAFFPVGGPREWSYTSDFATQFPETGKKARAAVGNTSILVAYNTSVSKQGRARKALTGLINLARNAENNYLSSHGMTNANPNDWSLLIKGINEILGTKKSFEENLNRLKKFEEGDAKKYYDLSNKLYDWLSQEAIKVVKENLNAPPASLVQEILQRGINRMRDFKTESSDDKTIGPYYELYNVINIGLNNGFLKSMTEIYKIEDFVTQYQQYLISGGKEPKLQIKGSKSYAASSAEELLTQATMGEMAKLHASTSSGGGQLIIEAQHPGPLNYKPDAVLFEATYTASLEESSKEIDKVKSTRVNGIRTAEQWFKNLEDAKGNLVISSNKSYIIDEMFQEGGIDWRGKERAGGFTAQSPMSLENFSSLADEINLSNVDYLIDYLANLGDNMILGNNPNSNILKGVATQVGHFLFDDLSFTPPIGLNVVHVFRLSGIYVPLSFVLHAVEQSLDASIEEMKQSVNIEIITGDSSPGEWSDSEFINFRNQKMKENKIKIHFLANFANLILNNV